MCYSYWSNNKQYCCTKKSCIVDYLLYMFVNNNVSNKQGDDKVYQTSSSYNKQLAAGKAVLLEIFRKSADATSTDC